ncbi:MAG: LemA family protein [Pseudomonadota bacterium]|nr:LemA family protein [Pseudomonadota bacterium]
MAWVWVIAAVLLAVGAWAAVAYNRLVRLRNQVRTAWADIDVQLTRRHDLVPQLVASVKAYAAHESALLETVTGWRARALGARGAAQLGQVESQLEQALTRVVGLQEDYPDLKASGSFSQLQRGLVEVEEHLQYARRFYNGAVRDYHNAVQRVPDRLVAKAAAFEQAEFFQAADSAGAAVAVELSP